MQTKLQQPSWFATREEAADLMQELNRTHRRLGAAVESFPLQHWDSVAPDGGWSASRIVEHIFLAQRVLRDAIRSHLEDAPRPELLCTMDEQRARLNRYLPGGGKAEAGKQSTAFRGLLHTDILAQIELAEREFASLLKTAEAYPVKVIVWQSPFFGELSALLWLSYPALHTARHVGQLSRLSPMLLRN